MFTHYYNLIVKYTSGGMHYPFFMFILALELSPSSCF